MVKDKPNPLCHPRLALVSASLLLAVTLTVAFQPALHLEYDDAVTSSDQRPFVYVNGSLTRAPVFDMDNAAIIVTDRYNLYRRTVTQKDAESRWYIPRHRFVNVQHLVPFRNTVVTLMGRGASVADTFTVNYEPDIDLRNQCDPAIVGPNVNCADLLRRVLDTIAADTASRLFADASGVIDFLNEQYHYDYSVSVGNIANHLAIRRASVFATDFRRAFRRCFDVTDNERDLELRTFRDDYDGFSQAERREVFGQLFRADSLGDHLRSANATEKSGALTFIRDVLVPGTSHVEPQVVEDLLSTVLGRLVQDENDEVSTLAMSVGILMSESNDAFWDITLGGVQSFLEEPYINDGAAIIYIVDRLMREAGAEANARTIDSVVDVLNVIRQKYLEGRVQVLSDPHTRQAIAVIDRHIAAQMTLQGPEMRERWRRGTCPITPRRVDCRLFSFTW
ncbi:MAG: hypothetical protein OXU74_10110 [Gemmatimonadota bacterium]|nr:hypothetical protein [Gemmatimonadota bacterium]